MEFTATVDSPVKRRTKRKSSIHISTHEGLIRIHVSLCRRMGYAPPLTYQGFGGHNGERSDAQQQRKEEAEAGQEQEERRRSVLIVCRHAQPSQARHLVHEPIRQEALAGDHLARPSACSLPFRRRSRQHPAAYFGIRSEGSRTIKRPTRTIQRALTVVRMSFGSRRIPYTCTASEPALELPRCDLARRTFGTCFLYECCPA